MTNKTPDAYYRIMKRKAGSDDEWKFHATYNSNTGRPYNEASTAKSVISSRLNTYKGWFWEYKIVETYTYWHDYTEEVFSRAPLAHDRDL